MSWTNPPCEAMFGPGRHLGRLEGARLAGMCHSCNSSLGTPRCARDSARGPLVMSSKMTSNGRDPYRIAIGLLLSPVSCGNTQIGWVRFLPARNSASTV